MSLEPFEDIEARIVAAEREIRALRAMLAAATHCRCPVGWGAMPDPGCPKHGTASQAATPPSSQPQVTP